MRYLLRQIGLYLIAAWASLTLNFFLPRMMPGDPVTSMLGRMHGRLTAGQIESIKAAYGFTNAPLINQYLQYLSHALRGDFGVSISAYPASVSSIIATGFMWTLLLGVVTLIISFVLGTALGVIIAWNRNGFLDSTLPGLTGFIGSFPYFWLAMVALYFFGFKLGWFPLSHAYSDYISPGFTWPYIGSVAQTHGPSCCHPYSGLGRRLDDGDAQHNDHSPKRRLYHHGRSKRTFAAYRDVQICDAKRHPPQHYPIRHVLRIYPGRAAT